MKSSVFNVFVPAKKGYALYNTLHESILFCDEELKNALETNTYDLVNPEYILALKKNGVIVEESTDEITLYRYRYNSRAFSTRKMQFVVVTTYKCNLACPYCYEGKGEVYSEKMDRITAERTVKAMQNRILHLQTRNVTLILFGGEPLLNMDVGLQILEEMRSWCRSKNVEMRAFMVTNGTLLTREKAAVLSPYLEGVQITLDGPQPFHDTTRIYRDGKGTYNEVVRAIETALDSGMSVSLRVQVSKDNYSQMGQLFQNIKGFLVNGKVSLNIAPLSYYSGMCSSFSSHFLEKEEQETVLPAILQYNPHVKPIPVYLPCVAFSNNFIFDPQGNIYTCITSLGGDRRIGYLNEQGDITWEYELYEFMGRNPLKISECRTCQYLPLCGGGCPQTAFLTNGTYQSAVCGGSKKVHFGTINLYLKRRFPERF